MTDLRTAPEPSAGPPGRPAERAVISGVGLICAAGVGVSASWDAMQRGAPEPHLYEGPPPVDHVRFPVFAAPDYDLAELGLDRRLCAWLTGAPRRDARDLRHLAGATALALADAGLPLDCAQLDAPVQVVVANESPGFEELSQLIFSFDDEPGPQRDPISRYRQFVDRFFELNTFLPPHYLARAFGFSGPALFVNSACASGLNALDVAVHGVRSGRTRIAVVAAADNPLSVAKYLWFHGLGLYASEPTIRPFDARQTGTIFGDGGAALIVEAASSAARRGAHVYAECTGAGFAQDGWKITVPAPAKDSGGQALQSALAEARQRPADIDLIVPHGIGAAASDLYEARLLTHTFGAADPWPAVTALKPFIGHGLGASALMETALLLKAMDAQLLPPTLGHQVPFRRYPLPLVTEWQRRRIDVAVKLTCAFGGYYGAVVFKRCESGGR